MADLIKLSPPRVYTIAHFVGVSRDTTDWCRDGSPEPLHAQPDSQRQVPLCRSDAAGHSLLCVCSAASGERGTEEKHC